MSFKIDNNRIDNNHIDNNQIDFRRPAGSRRGGCIFVFIGGLVIFALALSMTPRKAPTSAPATHLVVAVPETSIDRKIKLLLPAICYQESSYGVNRTGDKLDKWGRPLDPKDWSYGSLQIGKLCLADYNTANGTTHTLQDVTYDDTLSEKIFFWYLKHYAKPSRLGREPTLEDLARIWNGGPNGYKRRSTDQYWSEVSGLLFGHEKAYVVNR